MPSPIIHTSTPLSGKYFTLKPLFGEKAAPLIPEPDDRLYHPDLDEYSHSGQSIGKLSKLGCKMFDATKKRSIIAFIKKSNRDLYSIPVEMASATEFIQKAINFEHQNSPNAFKRTAMLKLSAPHTGGEKWHFDVKENSAGPMRTYCCTNESPTQYARIKFRPEIVDFPYSKERAHEFMIAASGFDRGADTIEAEEFYTAGPYEISRHNGISVHRGFGGETRILASLYYFGAPEVSNT